MSTLNDTDLFVIERSGTNYQVRSDEMSTLNDTDLLVVERAGVQYKIEATDLDIAPPGVIEAPVEVLTPLNGAGLNANGTYQPLSTALTAVNAGSSVVYPTDMIASVGATLRTLSTNPLSGAGNGLPDSDDFFGVADIVKTSSYLRHNDGEFTWAPGNAVTTADTCVVRMQYLNSSDGAAVQYRQLGVWTTFVDDVSKVTSPTPNTFVDVPFTPALVAPWDGVRLQGGGNDHVTSILGIYINGIKVVNGDDKILTFPSATNFDKFEVGDMVQDPDVSITAIDAAGPTITTDGGSWYGADGSGVAGDGRYEPAQQWSSSTSLVGSASYSFQNAAALFDGDINNFCGVVGSSALSNSGNCVLLTLSENITATKVEIYGDGSLNSDTGVWFNDATPVIGNVSTTRGWQTVYTGTSLVLNKIRWGASASNGALSISAIRINNTILVDSSVPGGQGATDVTKTVTSDASLTFTDDTELANMVGPLTMVDENGVDQGVSAADVAYLVGSTLGVSNITGTWIPGLYAQGAEITQNAPSPSSIVFTSSNGGTTAFTGTDTELVSRTWTLESGNNATGPWTVVGEYEDTSATASQDGSVNWTGHPTLEANKYYQIKVKYNASRAGSVESTFNTFKTGEE